MQIVFGLTWVIWATLMLSLLNVLVPAPRLPRVFCPGRTVNIVFCASMMMIMLLSYLLIIEQSTHGDQYNRVYRLMGCSSSDCT